MFHEDPPSSRWVRHTRMRYVAMLNSHIAEIERVGKRWHTTLTSILTGAITEMETRSTLSVAIQQAEAAAAHAADKEKQ